MGGRAVGQVTARRVWWGLFGRGARGTLFQRGCSCRTIASGKLTRRVSRLSSQALTADEVEELIRMADPDRDGKVPLEEFKELECWR